ncbi:hypothetical protein A3I34_00815 [Candidatus Jorgensenbacteria bacterium RIFCSPLOWO2_02_FULL_45_12]|uniref:DUF378 domain-containing protein n=2 Tax=Candidatus Joergenseniibacteriota TaxID=1752739 RepID=A0A1F6BPI2_9BACT|nr:MAG: hypothetical protein UX22_C0002G0026 [Candidatus Jorgensenbacteria bacterium GW2011_GWA2_45_9]OGG38844.1 MAG: hypothetical protein A3D55_02535 [Candidatus Jorgensenbacteria bacterium RIFCSPHIGHO2_02_FULL_45_20]OGG42230.1 MAG: hypothetical protein A3I34_00815 [Candidatus Jorgensenbacteria bacterium RIFCSPLOWO2_02_FULL_45_12]
MKVVHVVAFVLVVIGGLNWLLVGIFGWDIGELFGGQESLISRIIYVLVGIAAVVKIFGYKDCCRLHKTSVQPTQTPASM